MGLQFSVPIQTSPPKAHPACCTVCTGFLPGINWPGCGANHPCLSSARVGKWFGAVPPPPLFACIGMLWGDFYLYLFCLLPVTSHFCLPELWWADESNDTIYAWKTVLNLFHNQLTQKTFISFKFLHTKVLHIYEKLSAHYV